MTEKTEKSQKVSIPAKRIEALIRLAVEHDLAVLEVGPIRIVPRHRPASVLTEPEKAALGELSGPNDKPLTAMQRMDIALLGHPLTDQNGELLDQ